ncbi:hypothetical protein ACK8GG_06490 [Micromonosporaceae bacterium DT55]|uniref:hypothetical protein n=1 Tax=Melissospora conviva TaxID=3388432 RepID=UPI003C15A382
MTAPEEDREKSAKTDQVLFSPDGDPHHTWEEAPQPDTHLTPEYLHDDEVELLDGEQ